MEGITAYTVDTTSEYTYIIKITKHVAVKARNENEALRKAINNDGQKLGRDACVLLGKIKNEDKETE